jgi:hypothetical protein
VVIGQLQSSGLAFLFFWQRSTHKVLIQLRLFQTFGKTNSSGVKEQKRRIEIEIQELRTEINIHLDKLQENLMKELTEADKHVTEETRERLVSLDEKQSMSVNIFDVFTFFIISSMIATFLES